MNIKDSILTQMELKKKSFHLQPSFFNIGMNWAKHLKA